MELVGKVQNNLFFAKTVNFWTHLPNLYSFGCDINFFTDLGRKFKKIFSANSYLTYLLEIVFEISTKIIYNLKRLFLESVPFQ